MALKKRVANERDRNEAIEAFGNAAEPLLTSPGEREVSGSPKTMLLRFTDDPELVELLAVVAKLEGRKKHPMALRALRIGLEKVRSSYE